MSQIDPNEFIITRKRKLYKFALFANSPLCFEYEQWDKSWPVDTIEIGAGTGLFAVALARAQPDRQIVALDIKADRLQTGAKLAAELGLTNIKFLRARADQLPDIIAPDSLRHVWITFPDPFPKRRASGRRLTHSTYLKIYQQLLTVDGVLQLKHDNRDFFCWSLEQLVSQKWSLRELSFDLHDSDLSDEYKTLTTYETRWLREGLVTHFAKATSNLRNGTNH